MIRPEHRDTDRDSGTECSSACSRWLSATSTSDGLFRRLTDRRRPVAHDQRRHRHFSDAKSITNRYLTSLLSILSYASLMPSMGITWTWAVML